MTESIAPGAARRHFLVYLTATDRRLYAADYLNFRHMLRHPPGVPRVTLYIAVSRVRPFAAADRAALSRLAAMAQACPWFEVRALYLKGNIGRDFSSTEAALRAIADEAQPDDYVLVRNRSAYGPCEPNWYRRYVDQYAAFPNTGLVGSTINFECYLPAPAPATHVQTYAYLSQWRHLQPLAAEFPGSRCTDRPSVIVQGEVGLSHALLQRGLGLSCLHWPGEQFTLERPRADYLPQIDIKTTVRDVPLRYKYRAYFYQPSDTLPLFAWCARTARPSGSEPASAVPEVVLDAYG